MSQLLDLFLHLDKHLDVIITQYGTFTYVIVFIIILCETGLVIAPILPGDSLLFAIAAVASRGVLSIWFLFFLLWLAAVLGDSLNYAVGSFVGPKVFTEQSRFFKKEYLDRTHAFYEKHGSKTIIIARFMPIIRTFAPFVAGVGSMNYATFLLFNVIGGALWVGLFLAAGYFFGNIPAVQHNFTLVILGIVAVSFLPGVIEWMRSRRRRS